MWKIYWDTESMSVDSSQKVINVITELNCKYIDKRPIIIQIENVAGDIMCIGVGNHKGYSFIDYFPVDNPSSKHIQGENKGNGTTSFFLGDHESEFSIEDTITYQMALKVLNYFLLFNQLDHSVIWIDD